MATNKRVAIKLCRGLNSPLLNCVGEVKETEFYDTWNPFDGGKVCYCKNCCNNIFKYYTEENNYNKDYALYLTLQKIDIPYIDEVCQELKDSKKLFNVSNYITLLQKKSFKKDILIDFTNSNVDLQSISQTNTDIEEKKKKVEELENTWGMQDEQRDYTFLEKTFNKYTKGVVFVNPQQEDLYRDLCRDRLLLRKINDGRYNGEETIDKVQNRISKTMSTLKVDQFEQKKNKTDIEKILEYQIWEIENTEPAEVVDKEEYKDYLDINKTWGQHILRAVKNLLTGSKDYPNIVE